MNDKNLEERYLSVIEDNDNVSKTNILSELFFLLFGIFLICFAIYVFADYIAGIFIDNMSNENQVKIEKLLSGGNNIKTVSLHNEKIQRLSQIKNIIIRTDKNLQGKSKFPLYEADLKEINAFVTPDGKIYFTKGLLEKIEDEQILTFILAHELGHYAHRDHLKSIGRQLISATLLYFITLGQKDMTSIVKGFSFADSISHSQKQEKMADLYANNVVLKLYGTNKGAIKFFEYLKKEEKVPEFLYYISSHPSNDTRMNLLKKQKNKKNNFVIFN